MDKKHVILYLCAALIIIIPYLINNGDAKGTDDAAISEIEKTGYTPWIESILKPPSEEMETLLFGVQAAVGLIIIVLFCRILKKQNS
ncbi:energy-coupling factor ABC transporter substrate-binding protein [Methanobacterium sp. ACI-7]|uniref:energy-coupling factor ABC transporter substrate-binding protein n=1 Tax=unclassified Methanobacterium TaxID=2627676 RepID=UPI0039C396A9